MKDISDITVNQIRLFPVDIIPLSLISTQSCIQKIKESFAITFVETPPFLDVTVPIMFQRGEFKYNNQIIVINKIEIEPRRIIVEIVGTSEQANKVYELLLTSIATAANIEINDLRQPLLTAETTRCVITLDFHFNELLNSSFIGFLNDKVKNKASTHLAASTIEPIAIITQITYQIKDETLLKNKIGMNPKQFTIAPRTGIPLDEKRFVTSSPFDSDTHLKLLEVLNKTINKSGKS